MLRGGEKLAGRPALPSRCRSCRRRYLRLLQTAQICVVQRRHEACFHLHLGQLARCIGRCLRHELSGIRLGQRSHLLKSKTLPAQVSFDEPAFKERVHFVKILGRWLRPSLHSGHRVRLPDEG